MADHSGNGCLSGPGSDHRRSEIVLVKYEKLGHHYTCVSGIYNIGLFVMAFQTGSSGQVLFVFYIHIMITVRVNAISMSCDLP